MGMTRKPDEIKKGLECCISDSCNDCPYVDEPMERYCKLTRTKDALAFIQQLQDDNAQQARCIENMTDKLNAMNDEAAKLQAERDALLEYLTNSHFVPCDICKHDNGEGVMGCKRARELKGPCFEWRGVQKEDTDAR